MSDLHEAIARIFSPEGALTKAVEGFQSRASQVEFALAVADALENRQSVVVEAGTGTGKTFAYLTPALLSGSKTIVSTASKTLQDQLFKKDIGLICRALGLMADVAVLKGRNNYLCKMRLENLQSLGLLPEKDSYVRLKKIIDYERGSEIGDINEIIGVPDNDPLWPWVTSTKDNCMGSKCPHFEDCYVTQARRRAKEADVVIVNHHLFMADLSLKDESLGEILPAADMVIIDEAHKLADVGMDYFSNIFSLWELRDFADEGRILGRVWVKSVDWDKEFAAVRQASLGILDAVHETLGLDYDTEHNIADIEGFAEAMDEPMKKLAAAVGRIAEDFAQVQELNDELALFAQRASELYVNVQAWDRVFKDASNVKLVNDVPSVLWLRLTEQNVTFSNTPLSVSGHFRKARSDMNNAWVYTSATISTKKGDGQADFSYFLDQLGLDPETETHSWQSPFDYNYQARFYLPNDLPGVFSPDFSQALVDATWPLLQKTQGRAFFLCTSYRSMESIAECLRARMGANFTLCVQGESAKTELLERFKSADNAVLVGSMSFWEGVDIKGESLQLVIIDKMPFAQFDTPLARARSDWLKSRGKNAFMQYQLPEMITMLRQGVGRLIRSERDFGVVVFGDTRIVEKAYGRIVMDSLPPMIRTRDFGRVYSFLDNPDEAY